MPTEFVSAGDKTLAFVETGVGSAIIIIHGVGGHKEDWSNVAEALADSNRIFAVDMLGFGESSKTGDDLSMPVQAAAIVALMDEKGIDHATIIGNSVGGWVAATFAATYPERTDRLILIDAAGFEAMFEGEPPANFDPDNVDEQRDLIRMVAPNFADIPGVAEAAFESYVATGEKAIVATWGQSLFVSPRLESLLPDIQAPTLVMWGEDDKLFPSVLCGVFAGQIANAEKLLIPGAGHFPQMDKPDEVVAALKDFIT